MSLATARKLRPERWGNNLSSMRPACLRKSAEDMTDAAWRKRSTRLDSKASRSGFAAVSNSMLAKSDWNENEFTLKFGLFLGLRYSHSTI